MSDVELYKPNELIGAIDQIEVSRTAKHLLNFFLQYAQQQIKFHDHQGFEFEVDVNRINGLADIHRTDYEKLKKSLQALMQPVILRDDPKRFIALVPVTSIDIDVPNGLYKFDLQPRVVKLLEQTDYFTKLQLSEFNPLQSKHSIVILELLKRYEHAQKIPQISIEELRQITGTVDKIKYNNFRHIQLRILDVAVKEINEHTKYIVSYEAIKTPAKTRPKVTAIQFEFKRKTLNTAEQQESKPAPQITLQPPQSKQQSVTTAPETLEELLSPSLHIHTTDEAGNQIDIDAMYIDLADKFITYGFPTEKRTTETAKKAECYLAFRNFKYDFLMQFFERTKNYPTKYKFNWLREKSNKGYHARQQFQFEYLDRLRSDALTKSRMSQTEFEKLIVTAESQIGFASLLERLRRYLGETNPIKLLKYL